MTLKDEILKTLMVNRSTPISGQAMARQFSVSRTAVWKAIGELKAEGYTIHSTTNRGYQLSADDDHLSQSAIADPIPAEIPVYVYDTVDSTLSEAKRRYADGEKRFLIVSDAQTAGRGRRGRQFFSPQGTGLYLTLALPLLCAVEAAPSITAYAAVCVCRAIETLTGKQARIKWVNDVFMDGKKVCGILTEASTSLESGMIETVFIGIGINVMPCDVPDELKEIVGFVAPEKPIRNALAAQIADGLLQYDKAKDSFLDEYRARSLTIGRRVQCAIGEESFVATATGIDALGGLIVQLETGETRTLHSGEAKLI
ncbi:MAG TPA: biotin--[acetyl-CoA-carboxylase] ligase [Candidatus Limiplasma sp.]|nr:biotin--[acetyl-CoA-carboxylase] ligase [Candidatus Limiplasma sp.]HRX09719.1 biotin--[acetyl-CoA-carboxylase] ligase [Candidatus Limiplasma sp.]